MKAADIQLATELLRAIHITAKPRLQPVRVKNENGFSQPHSADNRNQH